MPKTATKKSPVPLVPGPIQYVPPAPTPGDITVSRAPEAGQALALRDQANKLQVVDASSHQAALEFIAGCKKLDRAMEAHHKKVKQAVDTLKKSVLEFERQDRQPVQEAIEIATRAALDFSNKERERIRQEDERRRREAEAFAQQRRDQELAEAEAKALELEATSESLSARELWFVTEYVRMAPLSGDVLAPRVLTDICRQAGYKNPAETANRLFVTKKITDAIAATRTARALREQALAKAQQPVDVMPIRPAEANLGHAAGVRETASYSAEVQDLEKFIAAYRRGEIDARAMIPNQVFLNSEARQVKSAEIFEAAYPGVGLKKKQGLAG